MIRILDMTTSQCFSKKTHLVYESTIYYDVMLIIKISVIKLTIIIDLKIKVVLRITSVY